MSKATSVTYISWAQSCSRSDHTARELGGVSHMVYSGKFGSRPSTVAFKYCHQSLLTMRLLANDCPEAVFVMSPPPLALLPVAWYARRRGIPFVVDAHSGAFVNKRWRRFQGLQNVFLRRAATTIVTNEHLATLVRQAGAHSTIIPDVPVVFPDPIPFPRGSEFTVAVAASFNYDEPTSELLAAARLLPTVSFLITGDPDNLPRKVRDDLPPNVALTSYLSTPAYGGLLKTADVVVALTTLNHTMLRGAYEAIYQETPVVVSDWPLLRESFPEGAVFVAPTASSIADGVAEIQANRDLYREGARRLKAAKMVRWDASKAALIARLGACGRSTLRNHEQ